jgi:hypothetical protein
MSIYPDVCNIQKHVRRKDSKLILGTTFPISNPNNILKLIIGTDTDVTQATRDEAHQYLDD